MKRVMLDTNIYGKILEEFHHTIIQEALERGIFKREFIIYGFDTIRKELRATSQDSRIHNANLRIALLHLYDTLIGKHLLFETPEIKKLALHYYKVYKELNGTKDESILNDLLIVACATINNLDIVYSEDNKTMFHPTTLKSYKIVDGILNLRTPAFESYVDFVSKIKRLLI